MATYLLGSCGVKCLILVSSALKTDPKAPFPASLIIWYLSTKFVDFYRGFCSYLLFYSGFSVWFWVRRRSWVNYYILSGFSVRASNYVISNPRNEGWAANIPETESFAYEKLGSNSYKAFLSCDSYYWFYKFCA